MRSIMFDCLPGDQKHYLRRDFRQLMMQNIMQNKASTVENIDKIRARDPTALKQNQNGGP